MGEIRMKNNRMGKLNYAGHDIFWNPRFELIYNSLNETHKEKFKNLSLTKKKIIVGKFVSKGYMI